MSHATSIDPGTEIGWTALTVADLARSLEFYTDVLGFAVIEHHGRAALLGVEATALLALVEQSGARPKSPLATGLYHFAVLVPTRADLARSLQRLVTTRYPLDGYADHLVSEALYLSDPDGNGIEIYRDRPRDEWPRRDGQIEMASDPIDLVELLAEAERDNRPWAGLPAGTRIGHMHLQVADLAQAEAFYHGVLGFDVMFRMPGALFVSAGGYHHHIGLNTWTSRGAQPPPPDTAGLRAFAITVPDAAAQQDVAARLEAAGVSHTRHPQGIAFRDPWRNGIVLAPRPSARDAIALAVADL